MLNNVKRNLYWSILKGNILRPPHLRVFKNLIISKIEHSLKKTKLSSYPSSVVLYINKNCNYNCGFCYNQDILNQNSLKDEVYSIKDLEKFFQSPYGRYSLRIALMGGEPFLNENIFELIKYSKKNRKIVNIVSNGSVIKEDDIDKISKSGLDALGLSLYDNNKDHIIRLTGSFNESHINYWVQTVIDATKLNEIEEKIQFAVDNKIKNFILSNYNPYFDNQYDRSFSESNKRFSDLQLELKRQFSKKINLIWPSLISSNTTNKKCTLPFSYIHLDKEGVVAPCCYRYPKKEYGNIYDEAGWNSEYNVSLRGNMLSNDEPIDECKNCENLYRNLYY